MASTQITTQAKSTSNINFSALAKATGIAAVAAIVGNLLILTLASLLLGTPFNGPTVNAISVIISTIVGSVIGGAVYALVLRYSSQPQRTFTIVGVVGYLVSLSGPLMALLGMMSGMTVDGQVFVAMIFMHTWTAAIVVWTLINQTRSAR